MLVTLVLPSLLILAPIMIQQHLLMRPWHAGFASAAHRMTHQSVQEIYFHITSPFPALYLQFLWVIYKAIRIPKYKLSYCMDWRKVPSLSALRAFEAAARRNSFTQAARELNVTQAAVAQHVRALEKDFGMALVTRSGRGIEVTQRGKELALQLGDAFGAISNAVDDLRSEQEKRPLTVTTTPGFAANWLMPRMGSFWTKYPDIQVNIAPSLEPVDLKRDGYDMAIRYGVGDWPDLDVELLTNGDFWVVAHPDLLKDRSGTCLSDVSDFPWIFEENMMERRRLLEAEGVDFSDVAIKLLATNTLVLSAVNSGFGVAIQSRSLVEGDVARGALCKICELHHEAYGYHILTLPHAEKSGLREFKKWLHAQV